jgi:hypothetical protein
MKKRGQKSWAALPLRGHHKQEIFSFCAGIHENFVLRGKEDEIRESTRQSDSLYRVGFDSEFFKKFIF